MWRDHVQNHQRGMTEGTFEDLYRYHDGEASDEKIEETFDRADQDGNNHLSEEEFVDLAASMEGDEEHHGDDYEGEGHHCNAGHYSQEEMDGFINDFWNRHSYEVDDHEGHFYMT